MMFGLREWVNSNASVCSAEITHVSQSELNNVFLTPHVSENGHRYSCYLLLVCHLVFSEGIKKEETCLL